MSTGEAPTNPSLHRALHRSLDLHEELLDGLPVGVVGLSEDGRVVLYNRRQEIISAQPRENVVGKPFFESVAPYLDDEDLRARFERALPPRCEASSVEWEIEAPGRAQPMHSVLYFRPLAFRDRHMVAIVVEDITERTVLQRERGRLLSALFHDLRSPLSGISSFAQLFGAGDEDAFGAAELREAMQQIGSACVDMIELIDATTHQLHGEAGDDMELLDLAYLAHGIALESSLICSKDGLQLTMHGQPVDVRNADQFVPVRIVASRSEAWRSIRNLLANACKYARSRIDVSIRDDGGTTTITVEDDGPGIPAGYEEKIFGGGVQAPGAQPGSGLGLETVRLWVEAMSGTVTADRSEFGGARFRLVVPTAG